MILFLDIFTAVARIIIRTQSSIQAILKIWGTVTLTVKSQKELQFCNLSEDEIQVSASKSSTPVVIFKNFWEETFLIESSLVNLESSTATFSLEIYSVVDDQKRTYSGDKNRQFQISILLHDSNNEIIYLSWKTIKAKRKQITFKLENLEKAASISLRQGNFLSLSFDKVKLFKLPLRSMDRKLVLESQTVSKLMIK